MSNFQINASLKQVPPLRREKFYKRRGASSSKYGISAVVSYPQWTPESF